MNFNSSFEKIISLLESNNIEFDLVGHEPVFTSEEAAKVRGFELKQGAKSLILKSPNGFVMAVVPGNKRLNSKKLKMILGVKDLRFATADEVKQVTGVEIGAVYPFGQLAGLEMFVDHSLAENDFIGFNPGVHDKSIKIRLKDYLKIVSHRLENIAD